ncbi:DNA ligase [Agrocybe pediades]|nr:DNA ligase [Agrocybe pediades]
MPKRASSASTTPTKTKRVKESHNQIRLDHFFASPSKQHLESKGTNTRSPLPEFIQGSSKLQKNTRPSSPEIIDVDAIDIATEPNESSAHTTINKQSSPKEDVSSIPSILAKVDKQQAQSEKPAVFAALDVDPVTYSPDLPLPHSAEAPYSLLTLALISLSQTRSRILIIDILTNVLRTIMANYPPSLLPAIYLLSNSLGPQFIPIELGLGSSILTRSIQQVSGMSAAALRKLYNSTGDPGDVAYTAKSNVRTLVAHKPLTIPLVYNSMIKISKCKGQGAAKEKQKIVEKLLLAANGEEVRYLTRTLCQNLRVGAVRTSILTALARAVVLTPPSTVSTAPTSFDEDADNPLHVPSSVLMEWKKDWKPTKGKVSDPRRETLYKIYKRAENLIKQVYVRHPSYDQIIPAILQQGLDSLAERVPLAVGVPLLPMLGSPTRSLDEIYAKLGELPFIAEYKYDGQRAQIHASRGSKTKHEMKIFSRHLEDMTAKYPDVTGLIEYMFQSAPDLTSFIIDAEIVAIDRATGALKSFQELSGRARKDVNIKEVKISVGIFAFDLMYLDGESLLGRSFRLRRTLLRDRFSPFKMQSNEDPFLARFNFVESCESTQGRAAIETFITNAVENRCEGLMIKLLDEPDPSGTVPEKQSRHKVLPATYEPDLRTLGWLKLKKDYMEGIVDSLDLIPVGAWYGNGRKVKWWSPVLLALWNPRTGRPVAVCKCMSGFTDTFYATMKETYSLGSELCSETQKWECDFGGFKPDVYFKPCVVWEIRGADITESPVSIAAQGLVSDSRGLSLRFPRFIRVKDDKGIEQASNPAFLVDMWRNQQGKRNDAGNDEGDLVDVDEYMESSAGEEEDQESDF